MRVLVCGGRDFDNWSLFQSVMGDLRGVECVIEGGATGADTMARNWAEARGIPVMEFPANWEFHGRAAGPIRNDAMIKHGKPDQVVAFPGGKGTSNMVYMAKSKNIPVVRVHGARS
jgi:hypothetical protein